ncbi:MAG: AI-2E family transporter [Patescibacteria group bacterium]
MANKQNITFDISYKAIFKVLVVLLVLGFLFLIRQIVGIVIVAFILTSAIYPWVDFLQRKKIPRWIGVLTVYILLFGVFIVAVILIIPPITKEMSQLAVTLPQAYEKMVTSFSESADPAFYESLRASLQTVQESMAGLTSDIFSAAANVFGGIISIVGVLVIAFYMVVEENGIKKFIHSVSPVQYQPYLYQLTRRIQDKMGKWLQGQILLSLIIGILTAVGLWVLGVKYVLLLALIAAVFEVIPFIGPILGAIPAVLIALTQSPLKALLVIILFVIIQQLENNIIVPKVMQRSVGLNPIIVIIVMLIGATVAGFLGLIVAVPIAAIISIVASDFFDKRESQESQLET